MVFAKAQPKEALWKMAALSVLYMLLPWDIFVQVADKRTKEIAWAMKRIKELTWELVQRKKRESLEEEKKGEVIDKEKETDLLSVLLKINREEEGLNDKELQAQVMTFLGAGWVFFFFFPSLPSFISFGLFGFEAQNAIYDTQSRPSF